MSIADKIRTSIEGSSWIRKMFEEGERLRKQYGADNVFDFTLGNPEIEPPVKFDLELENIVKSHLIGIHRYMSNAGYEETRGAIAKVLSEASGLPVQSKNIVMTCGASGAMNVVLKTILNPGDEVIILIPYFVEYKFYIDNHGGVPKEVWTDKETFQPDIAAIEKAISAKTKAIIINSPNNPTGVIYSSEILKELGALLKRKEEEFKQQIYLISDEPYSRIVYDGNIVPNVFKYVDNAVIVTSHSKDLAIPGERIGYLAANPKMEKADLFMEGAIFCNRTLGFVNAPALMQRLVTGLQRESVNIADYQRKRDILYDNLTSVGFKMIKSEGAFYLFPESPIPDDLEFVKLAQKHNILLVPGVGFGAPGYFRIAYCINIDTIERSLPAWKLLAADCGLGR
ncbi:MAG: pyridoxal phosphate-dependent aminotransferase [Desulfuromonadales bacterium]|nr:pyridoxal phosphate-dependent aminotransferase [Desulfuromonadales bacterium]